MKPIKKYLPVKVENEVIRNIIYSQLINGSVEYGDRKTAEEFDTEEEALNYAYEKDKWATWTILPITRFDNF